jgi:hypothetical protein
MKLPHRRQFLHLAAALPALRPTPIRRPRPAGRQGRSLAGTLASLSGRWAPLGKRMGRARSFSLLPPPAFGEGSYRRLTRLGIAGRWRSILVLRVPTSTSTATASKERTDRDRLQAEPFNRRLR